MEELLIRKVGLLKTGGALRKSFALGSLLLICASAAVIYILRGERRFGVDPLSASAMLLSCPSPPELLGCEAPRINKIKDVSLDGTLIAQDKSKGVTWMLDFESQSFRSIELPFASGNHESAVSPDGMKIAVPHYEEVTMKGQNEGGGRSSGKVQVIDIKTGIATVLAASPNPLGTPKPHDAVWLHDGSLLVTAQVANGFNKFFPNGSATAFLFDPDLCNTPHLVRLVPDSNLAVSGCRYTNAGGGRDGHMVIFDTSTGEYKSFQMGKLAEGITVTGDGDVWCGSQVGHPHGYVQVFSFEGRPKIIHNIQPTVRISVPFPLRLAWDAVANTVAVASLNLNGVMAADPEVENKLRIFDARSKKLITTLQLTTERGVVNMEGFHAFVSQGRGYFVTGGFDTQTIVVLEGATGEIVMQIYMPRCSTEKGLCAPTPKTSAKAQEDKETGSNNWSGGLCPATMRNPFERRWAVMDGFEWSPVRAMCP